MPSSSPRTDHWQTGQGIVGHVEFLQRGAEPDVLGEQGHLVVGQVEIVQKGEGGQEMRTDALQLVPFEVENFERRRTNIKARDIYFG